MSKQNSWRWLIVALGCVLVLTGCRDRVVRVDPGTEDPFSDTNTGSKDMLAMTRQMAQAITQIPQIANAKTPPTIAFARITNRTTQVIDKEMLLDDIRGLLLKHAAGKMVFLDRAKSAEILKEREMKRRGEVGTSGHKTLLGADYFLTGEIGSFDKVSGGKRSTYTRYSFRLTDAESSAIIWQDKYEFKKIGKAGIFDR